MRGCGGVHGGLESEIFLPLIAFIGVAEWSVLRQGLGGRAARPTCGGADAYSICPFEHFSRCFARLETQKGYRGEMTVTAEIGHGELAELVKQVQAGKEVLLTQDSKPVAKLVPADQQPVAPTAGLRIRSLKGHRVLTPVISQGELADEMFEPQ